MSDEVTFLEVASLLKITQNMVLERFGSAINASIFDASNLAGTLKQHGLIDFTAYFPGPNEMIVTEAGKALLAEAEAKAAEPFDKLDEAILAQLSGGKRIPVELQNTLNVRPKDLALRLYKLSKQGFIIYELKSGGVDLLLTESGFLKTSQSGAVQSTASVPMQQHQQMPMAQQGAQQQATPHAQTAPMPAAAAPQQQTDIQTPLQQPQATVQQSIPPQQGIVYQKKSNKLKYVVVLLAVLAIVVVMLDIVKGAIRP
jgi:hypothetical protein